MSERARDPQPYEEEEYDCWRCGEDYAGAGWALATVAKMPHAPRCDALDGYFEFHLGKYRRHQPPLWTFAWACVYVFLTTPFMRGFRHALAIVLVLAFCVALLTIYFIIAMTVKR